MTMRVWIYVFVLAYLPGALLFRLPFADRARRAQLSAEERVFWYVVLSLVWSLAVVLVLAAAEQYRFERVIACNAGLSTVLLLAGRARLGYGGTAARVTWAAMLPVVLVAIGLWRFFPASEYIIGGKDPGTYVNEGIQIAQRGTLIIHDPTVATVPAHLAGLFFPAAAEPNAGADSTRFMGFYLQRLRSGDVVGQFPHLFPASIALGYGLHGLTGARWAVGVWAILGLFAVYLLGARLVGRAAAFAATVLLGLHVIEVWFARYPNSEVGMQALLFATLLAFARAHQDGDGFFAAIAGSLAGAMIFLRVDALVVIAALATAAVLAWVVNGIRPRAGFVITLVAGTTAGLLYLMGPMRAYFSVPTVYLSALPPGRTAAAIVGGALLLAALVKLRRRAHDWLPLGVIAVLVGTAGYACFIRAPAGRLTDYDAFALRTFVDFYLLWPGFIATVVGLVVVVRRDFWRDPAFVIVFAAFALLFFFKIRVVPEHFWMARRFLPVILPGALLFCAAAALGQVSLRLRGRQLARTIAGAIFLGWLGQQYAVAAAPVMPHVEYAGVIPYLEKLAAHFDDRDLVIVEGRDAGSDTHVFALPLAYIYARQVLVLASARPDKLKLQTFLEDALPRYRRVLFVGGGGTDLLSRRIAATDLADGRQTVPEYASTPWHTYPEGVRRKDFDYTIYQLSLGQSGQGGFVLDIGERDDLYVVRFHAKERSDNRSIRWTGRQSFVSIPGMSGNEREVRLVLHDGGRPKEAAPAIVDVFFNDTAIGTLTVGSGFLTYGLPLPAELAQRAATIDDPAQLRLVTRTTWNPRALLGGPDSRDLGVMVDRVEVR